MLYTPDQRTTDRIWTIIVSAFALTLLISVGSLAAGMFVDMRGTVEPSIILSLFTAAIGFLAGLLTPTPGKR